MPRHRVPVLEQLVVVEPSRANGNRKDKCGVLLPVEWWNKLSAHVRRLPRRCFLGFPFFCNMRLAYMNNDEVTTANLFPFGTFRCKVCTFNRGCTQEERIQVLCLDGSQAAHRTKRCHGHHLTKRQCMDLWTVSLQYTSIAYRRYGLIDISLCGAEISGHRVGANFAFYLFIYWCLCTTRFCFSLSHSFIRHFLTKLFPWAACIIIYGHKAFSQCFLFLFYYSARSSTYFTRIQL